MKTSARLFVFVSLFLSLCVTIRAGEIWITNGSSYSTSGGSAASPVIVDTAAHFDAYMATVPPNSHIHLMAGTFQTLTGIKLTNGWTLQGDGIDRTFVQFPNLGSGAGGGNYLISYKGEPTNVYISDITLDDNFQNQSSTDLSMGAVLIFGTDIHLSRLKAINFGSSASANEDCIFAVDFDQSTYAGTNITIDGCIVTQPASFTDNSYFNGISICGIPSPLTVSDWETSTQAITSVGNGWVIGAEIKNCKVYGINASGHAFSLNNCADSKFHNNYVLNCPNAYAFGNENGMWDGLELAYNTFSDVYAGFEFDGALAAVRLRSNLFIHNNIIQNSANYGVGLNPVSSGASGYYGTVVEDNQISTQSGQSGLYLNTATNLVVTGNTINTPGSPAKIYLADISGITYQNNSGLNGSNVVVSYGNPTSVAGTAEVDYQVSTPTAGWYRIITAANWLSSKAVITKWTPSAGVISDLEINLYGRANNNNNVGTMNCVRYMDYTGGSISAVRMCSDGAGTVFVDIDVTEPDSTNPLYVKLISDAAAWVYNPPLTTNGPAPATVINFEQMNLVDGSALQTVGSLVVSNRTLTSSSGLLLSSQLDNANLTTIAGLSPASGDLLLGNGSSWTATGLSGDATLNSSGKLTVTNLTSTSGPIAGYQLISSATTLTVASARVVEVTNVITVTLPSSVVLGKEFLIENINASGAVTLSGTIVGASSIPAGENAIVVARPDNKWQVRAF